MEFIGWTYDIAREQSPREEVLRETLRRSLEAGYNAIGFYLEHRFAYASAPWAAGQGCLEPETVKSLTAEFNPQGLRIIPFLNTLGHMEGFIRSEGGRRLAEGPAEGSLQICPSREECIKFARGLVTDAMDAFDDEWVHLGGDETTQLGQCPVCAGRAEKIGKAGIYSEFFGPLCEWVLQKGRRPCLWGDMLIEHPEALEAMPKETVIFDWHYAHGPRASAQTFREKGFDVVCCPAVHTYDSAWCFLDLTRRNVDEHLQAANDVGALGVCVTTWELSFFTNYPSVLPVIYSAGRRLAKGDDWNEALVEEGGDAYARAADILGNRIPARSEFLRAGTWRQLRDRFVIRQDPFHLWRAWSEEACGEAGDEILRLCDEAEQDLDERHPLRFAIDLHRVAVQWVRHVEEARNRYAARDGVGCCKALAAGAEGIHRLGDPLLQAWEEGGSRADPLRLVRLLQHIAEVTRRVSDLSREMPEAGHLPAFETLTSPPFVPYDQAAWRTGRDT